MSSPGGWYTFHSRFWYIFALPSTPVLRMRLYVGCSQYCWEEICYQAINQYTPPHPKASLDDRTLDEVYYGLPYPFAEAA